MKTKSEIISLVMAAEINLETLALQVPGLSNHPFYRIVKYQLACVTMKQEPEKIEDVKSVFERRCVE